MCKSKGMQRGGKARYIAQQDKNEGLGAVKLLLEKVEPIAVGVCVCVCVE